MTWRQSVCMAVGRCYCPDVNTLVAAKSVANEAPIDIFYSATNDVLTKIDHSFFTTYSTNITGLLLVGLISATENYFRDVLGEILTICPTSQAHAAAEKIQLGSLLWAKNDMHNRSAFEFMAFSSGDNIKTTIKKFADYQIKASSNWDAMLTEYDKLCELRHAVVHSGHIVAGKNAIKLGLRRNSQEVKVFLNYASLQDAGKVCTSLVQSANNDLFEMLVERWATKWRSLPSWDSSKEKDVLKKIRGIFISNRDSNNKAITNYQSINKMLLNVKTAYNLL